MRVRLQGRTVPAQARSGKARDATGAAKGRKKAGCVSVSRFEYINKELHAEAVPLAQIAERYGTPCYVYSRAELTQAWRAFDGAFAGRDHLVCYAVKANSSLAVLNVFARLGSGFDIVSGGELARVLAAGGDPRKVVFSGVGKSADEMRQALAAGILGFNVESEAELLRLDSVAAGASKTAAVSLRVNPDVDPHTHPYIATGLKQNKFGIAWQDALGLYRRSRELPHVVITGIGCHIGSQLTEIEPFTEALDRVLELTGCSPKASPSPTWISAAVSESAIRTNRRPRSRLTHGH